MSVRGWRKLYTEELHNVYSSPNIISVIKEEEIGGACSMHSSNDKYVQHFGWKA
jgi:hypothetical protein